MRFGLKESFIRKVNSVFTGFPEIEEVIIYGSRAKGNPKQGSDIDLTIRGRKVTLTILNKVRTKLDDLLSPYTFDLSLYDQIENKELLYHIIRIGVTFYPEKME